MQRYVFHKYQLIPTWTCIFFVSAVLLCLGRSCHHRRGQGDHTHCVWAGERAPLLSWGHSNPYPCWGEWLRLFCNTKQYNSRDFSKPWGLDPCSFTAFLNCSHEFAVLKQALLLPAVKVRKGLFKGNSLHAINAPYWHHCFNQDNHLSACLSTLILRYEESCLALFDDKILSILTTIFN